MVIDHVANVATKVGMPIKLTIDNNYNDNTAEPNNSVNGLVNQHCCDCLLSNRCDSMRV